MRKRKQVLAAAMISCLAASQSHAEPGPTTNRLMNEPISLWDWGMFRIEQMRESATKVIKGVHKLDFIADSSYSWDNNEITISFFHVNFNDSDTPPIEAKEEKCREIRHTALQTLAPMYLLASPSQGNPQDKIELAAKLALEDWFSHPGGYQSSERGNDVGQRLARITYVEVRIFDEDKAVTCRGRISEWEPSYRVQQKN